MSPESGAVVPPWGRELISYRKTPLVTHEYQKKKDETHLHREGTHR